MLEEEYHYIRKIMPEETPPPQKNPKKTKLKDDGQSFGKWQAEVREYFPSQQMSQSSD